MAHNTNSIRILDKTLLTIATGVVTPTQMYHSIAAETGVTDDLDTINTSSLTQLTDSSNTYRPMLLLYADTGDTITLKHGTGNISLSGAADVSISGDDIFLLFYDGTNWCDVRNAGGSSGSTFADDVFRVQDNGDATKQIAFEASGIATATTRTITMPDADLTLVGTTLSQTLTNKTVSASSNTVGQGAGATKTISSGVAAASTDRNLIIAAETGVTDDLIEVTGLSVGETVWLRADAGDTITVKHNDAGATVKIYLYANADVTLDEQNPLVLRLVATNVLAQTIDANTGGTNLYTSLAILRDEKTSGTDGGSSSANTWNARDLNTEAYDPDGIVSISSNQFTPIAGDYRLTAHAPAGGVSQVHRLALYNETVAGVILAGISAGTSSNTDNNLSYVSGKFTANGTDVYSMRHYTVVAKATDGLGIAASISGLAENYLIVVLEKLA